MKHLLLFILSSFLSSASCFAQANVVKNTYHSYTSNSVLKTGSWIKLRVSEEGIYKITYSDLTQYGLNPAIMNPKYIRIFGNGGEMLPEYNALLNPDDLLENAVYVKGEEDGVFNSDDYILFYGQSPHKWYYDTIQKRFYHKKNYYSESTFYFLTYDNGEGKRIEAQASSGLPPTQVFTTFHDYAFHENDLYNLIKSGKEWVGEKFENSNPRIFPFLFPNIQPNSTLFIKTQLFAKCTIETEFLLQVAGETHPINIDPLPNGFSGEYAKIAEDTFAVKTSNSTIPITLQLNTPSAIGWLNFIELNATRSLTFSGENIFFRNIQNTDSDNISQYIIQNASSSYQIWDLTNPFQIKKQETLLTGTEMSFCILTDTLKQFVLIDPSICKAPAFVESVKNQNLHGLSNTDIIIITHPNFINEAHRLADLHLKYDQLNSVVTTPNEIYNEFSSGSQDVAAIRNFVRMFYERYSASGSYPKYLLLFGDASYDYKDTSIQNTNYVPAYQSLNSLIPTVSYVTDDFFGLLDSLEGFFCNGDLDIGIGRFIVRTKKDAENIINKIEIYIKKTDFYTSLNGCTPIEKEIKGDWRNNICFIADDEDNNIHQMQADDIATYVDTNINQLNVYKVYLDAYTQINGASGTSYPDVNRLINKYVTEGALMINYTGHGGETGWTGEKVLQISDIQKWTNLYNLPIFITASCEFSRYDDPDRISAGEYILINEKGGGIALYTTSRLAFSNTNFGLNKSMCKFAFENENGHYHRLGDIIRLAKIDNGSIPNNRNFILLGDPALKLSIPENSVKTTHINGLPESSATDTLKALNKITINGIITNYDGGKLSNFNGKIYPTVYDKKYTTTTLSNDQTFPPFIFKQQENILYKGVAKVTNGDFSFSFILPKDMNKDFGEGKISYYAKDSITDASGYYENTNFIIGGIDSLALTDNMGPSINLFLNNTQFSSGGTTDGNPILLAFLSDSSGINHTGIGYGHNISLVIDENTENSIILDNYYMPDADTYQSGILAYPLSELAEGPHTISLKAWDIYNNASTSTIDFFVTTPSNLKINYVSNYPNPLNDITYFNFKHNQPCCDLNIEINIYSMNGSLVKTISKNVETIDSDITPIAWNGCNDKGIRLSNGAYIYRVRVRTLEGTYLESSNKLIIIK